MPTHVAVLAKRAGCWRGLLGFSLAATVAVLVANVSDRLSFRSALHGAKQVNQEEWAAMFAKARELAQAKLLRLKGGELPAEFACLRARDADFFQNHAQLRLYTRGELAVYLDFDLNPEWRTITLSVSGTPPRSWTVWSADPALVARLEPKGRVLTVTMDDYRRSQRMGIALPSELRVVEQDFRLHTHTAVGFPLPQQQAEKIMAAVAAIPSGFRGRLHTAGGSHGIGLRMSFRADGQPGMEDIELANIWRDEVGALLEAISTALPQGRKINFKARLAENPPPYGPGESASYTWAEIVASERQIMNFPWWCVWPRWFGERVRD